MPEQQVRELSKPATAKGRLIGDARSFRRRDGALAPWRSTATMGIVSAATAAGLAILYFKDPADGGFYPSCIFHYLTGFHCPGCGTLRALHQLLHGNFAAAWAMNPLAIAVMPGLAAVIVCGQVAAWRELPDRISHRLGPAWIWSLFFVIVAYGILRNVPIWPCTFLAPH